MDISYFVNGDVMFSDRCRFMFLAFVFNQCRSSNTLECEGTPDKHDCNGILNVNWSDYPPYVYRNGKEIQGIFKTIVERLVRECCCCLNHDCIKFHYLPPLNSPDDLQHHIGHQNADLNLPLYGINNMARLGKHPFFPVVESPGIIFLQGIQRMSALRTAVVNAAFAAWPVLVLALIMAAISGILIWALDSYWNPEEFPSSFLVGAWEGFWCAFVSMTTVGYGDKAPRSTVARIFTICWVLIGIVVISVFTATVTTSLTTLSLSTHEALYGKNLAVYETGEEFRYGVKSNNNMKICKSIGEFIKTVKDKKDVEGNGVDGGLMDAYVAGFQSDQLTKENGIDFSGVIDHQFVYGFTTSNRLNNSSFTSCLRRKLNLYENFILSLVQRDMRALPEPKASAAEERSANLFDHRSLIFKHTIYACAGIIVVLVLCGIAWRHFVGAAKIWENDDGEQEQPEVKKPDPICYEDLIVTQCIEYEKTMIDEVTNFQELFQRKLEMLRTRYREKEFSCKDHNE